MSLMYDWYVNVKGHRKASTYFDMGSILIVFGDDRTHGWIVDILVLGTLKSAGITGFSLLRKSCSLRQISPFPCLFGDLGHFCLKVC